MKKLVTTRYWELVEKFKKKPSGDVAYDVVPDYLAPLVAEKIFVSYRHYACLAFLVMFQERTPESVAALHDAVAKWRRKDPEYKPDRTLIQIIARRSYQKYKKWLRSNLAIPRRRAGARKSGEAAKKNKTGIFHPSVTSEMHAAAKKKWHEVVKKTGGYRRAKWWLITCPDGRKITTNDVPALAKKEGFNHRSLKNGRFKVNGYTMEPGEPPHPEWMIMPYKEDSGYDPRA